MLLADLAAMAPTANEEASFGLWTELCRQGWRCYSSELTEMMDLAERFVASHARIPGVFGNSMVATRPVEVFGWQGAETGNILRGVLFLNGAVAWVRVGNQELTLLLVDEETASTWGYPEDYERMERQVASEET